MKWMIAIALTVAACGKDTEKGPPLDPPTTGSGSAAPTDGTNTAAGSGSGSGSAADTGSAAAVDVPTEMDYEDLANEEITDKTVEARLKALETELAPQ